METQKETAAMLENIASGIATVQELGERNQKQSAIDGEQIAKITDDVTKTIEALNVIKAREEKVEKSIKNLETTLARPTNAKEAECSEAKIEFLRYFRKGIKPSTSVLEEIAQVYAKKICLGGDENEIKLHTKALVEGNNPDGGFWIRPEIATFTVDRLFETSPMRNIASVITIGAESIDIIVDDNQAAGDWVGEVDPRPETATPQIGLNSIFAHELAAFPAISQRMLDDAGFDVEAWLQRKVTDIFMRKENTAFVVGDGSKKPRGFLTYPAWANVNVYERNKIAQLDSTVSASFDADDLISLQNLLLEGYQARAVWTMQRATFAVAMKLKDLQGQYLLNPSIIAEGANKLLLGKPVMFFDDMPALASDALAVAYGDFEVGYTIVDRIGMRILRDPFTNKPFVNFYTTKRVGGDVTNYQSLKLLKLAA